MGTKTMEEIAVVMRKFGDEQSTLLDQFERLTFEVKLNQAILARSLSEPSGMARSQSQPPRPQPQPPLVSQVQQGCRLHKSGFNKILKKLLKPILGSRNKSRTMTTKEVAPNPKDPKYFKAFSRSLRF